MKDAPAKGVCGRNQQSLTYKKLNNFSLLQANGFVKKHKF